jgi:anaerobic sulfite reductase subunit C
MNEAGILPGRHKDRVTLRVQAIEPYSSELTGDQIGIIADIAETYGSGVVHVTPRQTVEIPDIGVAYVKEINDLLNPVGLYPGSSGGFLRNVISCSRWCLYNALPLSDLAQRLNRLYHDRTLPGKTIISLSGCDFSCVRSRTSDIGIISRAEIELTDKECKKCSLCIKEPLGCQVDAINITDEGALIDTERCVRCGFCTNVCKPGTIKLSFRTFDLYVGGSGGLQPKEARFYKSLPSEDAVIDDIDEILDKYASVAEERERIGDVLDKLGLSTLET